MKRILFIYIAMFFLCISSVAQIPLSGVITVQNSRTNTGQIEYVPNAQITADGAVPTTSDSRGQFTLNFTTIRLGDDVSFSIDLHGVHRDYEIVNFLELEQTLGRRSLVNIYISRRDELERRRAELVGINLERIEREYERREAQMHQRLRELQNEQFQNIAQIDVLRDSLLTLRQRFELQKKGIESAADRFIRINLDFEDKNYFRAYNYFRRGELDSALMYIPKSKFDEIILLTYREIRNARLRISVYQAMGDHNNVIKNFYEVVRLSRIESDHSMERFEIVLEYAEYLYGLNKLYEAEKFAKEAAGLRVNEIYKIRVYNLIGQIQERKGIPNAYRNYLKAVRIHERTSIDERTSIQLREAAISHTLLADHYNRRGRMHRAERYYRRALDIYIEMYKNGGFDNANHLNLLIKLAVFYTDTRKPSLVRQINERITLLTAKIDNPRDIARINETMGYLQIRNREFAHAVENFKSALAFYEERNSITPIVYQNRVIRTTFMTAFALNRNGQYDKSIEYSVQALRNIDSSSNVREQQILKGYILALKSHSYAQKYTRNNTQARYFLQRAEEIAREVNDPNLNGFVQNIRRERMHNIINFMMDWVVPYIGMIPALVPMSLLAL